MFETACDYYNTYSLLLKTTAAAEYLGLGVPMMLGVASLSETGLSFLNIGVEPPKGAWGAIVYGSYDYLTTNPMHSIQGSEARFGAANTLSDCSFLHKPFSSHAIPQLSIPIEIL